MRKILLTVFGFAPLLLLAQTITFIEPRNVQGVPEADFSTYTAGSNLYILQQKYRMMAPVMYDLQLDAYDAARKPIGTNAIDRTLEMGDANLLKGFHRVQDHLAMFKAEYSKASGSKMAVLWYYPLDETGKRTGKKQVSAMPVESAGNSGNFFVSTSPDGNRIAVLYEMPFEKDGMERCVVTVYNPELKQVWKKEYSFPYQSSRAPKNTIYINNAGSVFLLKQINLKKAFDQFSIFSFMGDGKTVVEKKIDLGNGFTISSSKQLFKANGDLVIAGYSYMNKKVGINVETPDAVFFTTVSAANGDLTASKLTNLKSPSSIVAAQLLEMPGDTYCLTGEQRSISSTPINGKPFEYTYSYNYGPIHLTRFATDGSQQWTYSFNRDLKSVSDGGRSLGTYSWVTGNEVQVLFADYANRHDDKKMFIEFGSARINLIQTIGANGTLTNERVITDPRIGGKRGEYLLIPLTGSIYQDNRIFMLAARGAELVGTTVSY